MASTLVAILLGALLLHGVLFALCARWVGRTRVPGRTVAVLWLLLVLANLAHLILVMAWPHPLMAAGHTVIQTILLCVVTWKGLRLSLRRALATVVVFALVAGVLGAGVQLVVSGRFVHAYRVPTASMQPTLEPGDLVLVWKRGEARRGDCIAYAPPRHPEATYLHRIVGMPGDVVEYAEKKLVVNGREVHEPWARLADGERRVPARDDFGPFEVPDGTVFVMGDNRDRASDSRYFGPVDMEAIEGRVGLIFAPLGRWRVLASGG